MHRVNKGSIRSKLISLLFAFMAFGFILNTGIQLYLYNDHYADLLKTRAYTLADSLRFKVNDLLQQGLKLNELPDFSRQCQDLLKSHKSLEEAFITDEWNRVLYSSSQESLKPPSFFAVSGIFKALHSPDNQQEFYFQNSNGTLAACPLYDPYTGQYLGAAVIRYSDDLIFLTLSEMSRNSIFASLILLIFLTVAFYFVLSYWVNEPIRTILKEITAVRHGTKTLDLDSPLLHRNREFDLICRTFVSLYKKLETQEQEIREHSVHLETMVAMRTEELEALNKELLNRIEELEKMKTEEARLHQELERSKKMEVIGNLASGVAHDLNNILSSFVNYPELMLMELEDDSPLIRHIQAIKNAGVRAAAMVQDLMTLARRGVALLIPLKTENLINELSQSPEFLSLQSQYPRIDLSLHCEASVSALEGIPFHINKALMNLLSNALEAIRGSGRVELLVYNKKTAKENSLYETLPPGNWVCFTVKDSGEGMSPEVQERIFEPFFTKKNLGRRSGTGLGMSVVYSTVKEHRGYIDVQSKSGEGSSITLYFPAFEDALSLKPETEEEKQPAKGRGEKILIIDDMPEQREIAKELLTKLNYEAFTSASGEEGLEFFKTQRPDLILLDMIMDPGIDGYETFIRLRELDKTVKVLIVSGYSETAPVKEMQELGAKGYLKKPYTLESLSQALEKSLKTD